MNISGNFRLIAVSLLSVAGLAACDKPGPAESAGRTIDESVDAAGRKLGQAADKVGEAADRASDKLGEKSDKAGVAVDDAEITAKVKAAVFAEPGLRTLQISVDTVQGVVRLTGSVESQASFERASALAEAVAGVRGVENYLHVNQSR